MTEKEIIAAIHKAFLHLDYLNDIRRDFYKKLEVTNESIRAQQQTIKYYFEKLYEEPLPQTIAQIVEPNESIKSKFDF